MEVRHDTEESKKMLAKLKEIIREIPNGIQHIYKAPKIKLIAISFFITLLNVLTIATFTAESHFSTVYKCQGLDFHSACLFLGLLPTLDLHLCYLSVLGIEYLFELLIVSLLLLLMLLGGGLRMYEYYAVNPLVLFDVDMRMLQLFVIFVCLFNLGVLYVTKPYEIETYTPSKVVGWVNVRRHFWFCIFGSAIIYAAYKLEDKLNSPCFSGDGIAFLFFLMYVGSLLYDAIIFFYVKRRVIHHEVVSKVDNFYEQKC